ncbi:type II 3-dehydroquinate dehydratase [Lysobacter sp. S4-A87]|uniref:type II 3-dehydroquinate dehydratase n=1 Tax=Lysobacter sp. S4-A87 TaxID=2925843 RepID=UPI001F530019|nr:type II 3-dehydroquinate dehydratase [Lysobacter sp. S4-A87]UNK49026.1 type II 3-dehydroquinate dehydratase [Lysobacter sp. S4-A87]
MDIQILQGSHSTSAGLPRKVFEDLRRASRAAGSALKLRASTSIRPFIESIRHTDPGTSGFVVLDPGDLARDDPQALRDALESLAVPYAEVHDSSDTLLDLPVRSSAMPIATIVINGDLSMSYRIAVGIGLRRIARWPSESAHSQDDFHNGT